MDCIPSKSASIQGPSQIRRCAKKIETIMKIYYDCLSNYYKYDYFADILYVPNSIKSIQSYAHFPTGKHVETFHLNY